MKKLLLLLAVAIALALGVLAYHQTARRVASGEAPAMLPVAEQADFIRVFKAQRRLQLLRDGQVLREYAIALGGNPEGGHKQQEGDQRTPEGLYRIDWRNPNSMAHLSLHISYPDEADRQRAQTAGVAPGGFIMIHGIANGWGWLGEWHRRFDWTDGCIAVTNPEVAEIWSMVANGTPIEIMP